MSGERALIVHHLPEAPKFAGREEELTQVRSFWNGPGGVLSLIGSGGAGKTALLAEFLKRLMESQDYDRLIVWSFYDDPNTNAFLTSAYRHFAQTGEVEAKGAGWFHLMKEVLSDGGRYLLVLDGLERVQRTQTDSKGIYGELEDPLLHGLLQRLVVGAGKAHVLITSRFPITDLENHVGRGHVVLDVDHLDEDAAIRLLVNRGVKVDSAGASRLIQGFGNHALTLDLLGGALQTFLDGDPEGIVAPDTTNVESTAQQPLRLATVLHAYQTHLPQRMLDLLSRLCIFRFGIAITALEEIFLKRSDQTVAGALAGVSREQLELDLDELCNLHLVHRDRRSGYTIHPAIRDHFYRLFRDPKSIHQAVSAHLMTLSARPGIGLPEESESLDVLEELIYHALQAGQVEQARSIYTDRLGGGDHLNTRLGEYTRCSRILQAFDVCPDPGAMYHCQRAFGHFDAALEWRPQNRYILLLCGRLPLVLKDGSETARRAAAFLMGLSPLAPDRCPDYPLPAARFMLIRGRHEDARRMATRDIEGSLYRDDIVRNMFALAEAELQLGRESQAQTLFDDASTWAISSGSHEHLVGMHLLRAKFVRRTNPAHAFAALTEAMQLAEDAGFVLAIIDTLVEQMDIRWQEGDWPESEALARRALNLADDPDVRYAWGKEAALRHIIKNPSPGDREGLMPELMKLRDLQTSLDHFALAETERMLARLQAS